MQKWLMTIRSFNMLTNHKNKEAPAGKLFLFDN